MSHAVVEQGLKAEPDSGSEHGWTLSDLLDPHSLQTLADTCFELSGIGLAIFDQHTLLAESVGSHPGPCAQAVLSEPDCGAKANRSMGPRGVKRVEGLPSEIDEAVVLPCHQGLCHLVVPIRWGGNALGRLSVGPLEPECVAALGLPGSVLRPGPGPAGPPRPAPVCPSTVTRTLVQVSKMLQAMLEVGQRAHRVKEIHWRSMEQAYKQIEHRGSELQEMKTRLVELDRLKSSFLATVSHELRTPLTAIIGYSEMLNERLAGPLNREQAEYVRTILEKSEMLLKLISSILELSEIEAKKVRLQFEWVEAADVVQSALLSMRPQAAQAGVQVEADLPESPVLVRADVQKLRQVVMNLLANAIKFTPKGGQVILSLSAKRWQPELAAEGYRVSVQDSGVGIPPDQFDKIFQSFYQVDSSFTRGFGGAGLGLAIVKSFVEAHGGIVCLESEVGRGSHFGAVIPAVPPVSTGLGSPCAPAE